MRETARRIAEIDLLASFANLASLRGWVRPEVDSAARCLSSCTAVIRWSSGAWKRPARDASCPTRSFSMRRPCGDRAGSPVDDRSQHGRQEHLSPHGRAAGRRWAQCGCFVPAETHAAGRGRPHLHPHRRKRQRGAWAVDLHGGDDRDGRDPQHSHGARVPRSMLDEMGRGTATYDGLSLAWATVEHVHEKHRRAARSSPRTIMSSRCWPTAWHAAASNVRVTVKEKCGRHRLPAHGRDRRGEQELRHRGRASGRAAAGCHCTGRARCCKHSREAPRSSRWSRIGPADKASASPDAADAD